jgi:hypothetical protein
MPQNFCFSILALKPRYQLLAKQFAEDLKKHAPEVTVVVGTDNPQTFQDCSNVSAFKLKKKGILHCYHDKRFVLEQALTKFQTAIQIDADTRVMGSLPERVDHFTGLAAVHIEDLLEHAQKYNPERIIYLHKLADKLKVDLATTNYVGESLFAVSADKASEFFKQWDLIARYLELHGIHAGEGNAIGLAAAKAGMEVSHLSWLDNINQVTQHFDASQSRPQETWWNNLEGSLSYHYRLNKARVTALKDFKFYYQ